jgi:hypothetical protein
MILLTPNSSVTQEPGSDLSLAMLGLFLLFLAGWYVYNSDQQDHQQPHTLAITSSADSAFVVRTLHSYSWLLYLCALPARNLSVPEAAPAHYLPLQATKRSDSLFLVAPFLHSKVTHFAN